MTITNERGNPKLALVVARKIEDELTTRNWPVGEVIASEQDLLDRFGVSRAALREAMRIVEHTGGARMCKGPGGGLMVTKPNRAVFTRAAGVYLASQSVTVQEVLDVRDPLVVALSELAAERAEASSIREVIATMDAMAVERRLGPDDFLGLQQRIVDLARNPVLSLLLQAIGDVTASRLRGTRARLVPQLTTADALTHLRGSRILVDAIASKDPESAAKRTRLLNQGLRQRLQDRPARPRVRMPVLDGSAKLAEKVAVLIRDDIERAGWNVGSLLGSEAEIVERYGVSRAVLREAIRILEYHGSVMTRRGPGGGIFVAQPDSGAAVHAARVILDYDGAEADNIWEARQIVEDIMVRLAARRADQDGIATLREALEVEAAQGGVSVRDHVVHRAMAEATGNRVLVLLIDVLAELATSRVVGAIRAKRSGQPNIAETHRAHQLIVEAIIARDADKAARRLRRHLQAAAKLA